MVYCSIFPRSALTRSLDWCVRISVVCNILNNWLPKGLTKMSKGLKLNKDLNASMLILPCSLHRKESLSRAKNGGGLQSSELRTEKAALSDWLLYFLSRRITCIWQVVVIVVSFSLMVSTQGEQSFSFSIFSLSETLYSPWTSVALWERVGAPAPSMQPGTSSLVVHPPSIHPSVSGGFMGLKVC